MRENTQTVPIRACATTRLSLRFGRSCLVPPGRVGTFIQMSGGPGGGPDGILCDSDDNLVVAHARMGAVWVFSRMGEPLFRLRSCKGPMTTNVAFGGPDRRRLFITESATGTILTAILPTPGRDPGWAG